MGKGRKLKYLRIMTGIVCLLPTGIAGTVYARDTIPEIKNTRLPNDTVSQPDNPAEIQPPAVSDSIFRETFPLAGDTAGTLNGRTASPDGYGMTGSTVLYADDSLTVLLPEDSARAVPFRENGVHIAVKDATAFKPNPRTAYLIAAVFPGFGQAYNRQYWKLPIVYGGLVGFMYAITWNNKVYQDYKKAYFDMRIDYNNYRADPDNYGPENWSTSWQDFTNDPLNFMMNQNNHTRLQKGRDYYRRYRDLSIILSVVFYAICIADAYVDAQMFDFDISPDLSFRVAPEFYPSTLANSRSFGLNVCMTF
jgi:hypothetical protein